MAGLKRTQPTGGNKAALAVVLVSAVLLISMLGVFAGCGGASLEGTWVSDDKGETVVITGDTVTMSDGTMELEFTYELEGDQIVLSMEGLSEPLPATYKLEGDKLTITADGDVTVYTRK
jgi:hypothetical protein